MRRPRVAGAARRSATTPAGPPGSIGRWRAVVCGAALVALLSAAAPGSAQNASRVATEESVKAAYLYKFAAYVDWPPAVFEGPDSAFTIAVMEDERLAAELAAVTEGRSVRGRPIRTRRLAADDPLADVHVLFLPPRDRGRANAEPPSADLPILTVADSDSGQPGIVLTFVTVNGRVRFEADLTAAQRRGLRLHSGLLTVAERVHGARP